MIRVHPGILDGRPHFTSTRIGVEKVGREIMRELDGDNCSPALVIARLKAKYPLSEAALWQAYGFMQAVTLLRLRVRPESGQEQTSG